MYHPATTSLTGKRKCFYNILNYLQNNIINDKCPVIVYPEKTHIYYCHNYFTFLHGFHNPPLNYLLSTYSYYITRIRPWALVFSKGDNMFLYRNKMQSKFHLQERILSCSEFYGLSAMQV